MYGLFSLGLYYVYSFVFTPDQTPQIREIYASKRIVVFMFLAFSTPAIKAARQVPILKKLRFFHINTCIWVSLVFVLTCSMTSFRNEIASRWYSKSIYTKRTVKVLKAV